MGIAEMDKNVKISIFFIVEHQLTVNETEIVLTS